MSWIAQLARPEVLALKAYEHASWDPSLTRMHANELPWRPLEDESVAGLNRYPEPQSRALIERLAQIYDVGTERLLISRGSDEAIDLLVRCFCRPGQDAILLCPPTFGMYALAARIQGANVVSVPLDSRDGFALDAHAVIEECKRNIKLIFLCSPNNPTGNCLCPSAVLEVADAVRGSAIVVVDEAYIEFAERASLTAEAASRPQLAILRTLSKAHGLAGARVGTLIADPAVIALLRRVIAPYAVPQLILEAVNDVLNTLHVRTLHRRIAQIRAERARMQEMLAQLPGVIATLPSDANFLLARFANPAVALARAIAAGIQVRDVRGYPGLEDGLRISIGTIEQNNRLMRAWAE